MALKIPCSAPLQWPASKARCNDRRHGNYTKGKDWNNRRNITMSEARTRVLREIGAFSPGANYSVIDPWDCVLSTNMEVNLDGTMRARQRKVIDPGAALTFPWQGKEQIIAIDVFTELEQNIAAIAATLDALRRLHRLDSSVLEQALSGFAALPAPVTRRHWRDVFGGTDSKDIKAIRAVYRKLAAEYHPDRSGNADDGRMADLNLAWNDAKSELSN